MSKVWYYWGAILGWVFLISCEKEPIHIGIAKYIASPANNLLSERIVSIVSEKYPAVVFVSENADGRTENLEKISLSFAADSQLKLRIAIDTPMAQSFAEESGAPIIYTGVTDPENALLTQSTSPITGYSDAVSIETFFQYIKTLMPRLSLLGQIESMGEPDSRYITGVIRYRAAIADIDSTKTSIMRNIRQIPDAVNALVSKGEKVEVLYLANSSYLFRNLDTVVKIANRNSVPVVSSDPISAAGSGVIFAYGPNYAKLAEATADLIIQFLGAESEAQQQDLFAEKVRVIEGDDAAQVYVDAAAAAQFGITIPPEILALSRNLSESPQ